MLIYWFISHIFMCIFSFVKWIECISIFPIHCVLDERSKFASMHTCLLVRSLAHSISSSFSRSSFFFLLCIRFDWSLTYGTFSIFIVSLSKCSSVCPLIYRMVRRRRMNVLFTWQKRAFFLSRCEKNVLRRCVINPRRPCSTFWLFSVICVQLIADKKSTVHSWSV